MPQITAAATKSLFLETRILKMKTYGGVKLVYGLIVRFKWVSE